MLMRHANYDTVSPRPDFDTLPAKFTERSSQPALVLKAVLLGFMSLLVAAPLALIAIDVAAASVERALPALSPVAALQLGLSLVAWAGLFVVPLAGIVARIGRCRSVEITRTSVHLDERSLFGSRRRSLPLAGYRGVTYRVRTTLSGARHEVVLVHPKPEHSVLLAVADHAGDVSLGRAMAVLGLPEVPARELQSPQGISPQGMQPASARRRPQHAIAAASAG
jgi:hypothetical protein